MENQASSITLEASLENLKAVNSFIRKWAKRANLSPGNENNLLVDNVGYEREGNYNVLTLVKSREKKIKRRENKDN